MNYETTKVVDTIGQMHFEGNITPIVWFKHIKFASGKADTISIAILSDIVYWYRPTIVRDEQTGLPLGNKKKFKADLLQKSYQEYANLFGLTKLQVVRSIERLEKLGLIRRVLRNVTIPSGILSNVLFIELIPDALRLITFSSKSSNGEVDKYQSGCGEVSTLKSTPIPPEVEYTYTTTETTTSFCSAPDSESASPPLTPLTGGDVSFRNGNEKKKPRLKLTKEEKEGRVTRLPKDWVLPLVWRSWSLMNGMSEKSVDSAAFKFKCFWLAAVKNTKSDWYQAWRYWCSNEPGSQHIIFKEDFDQEHELSPVQPELLLSAIIKQSSDPKIQKWNEIQPRLKERIGSANYNSWIAVIELISLDEVAIFKVPSSFWKDQIVMNFLSDIIIFLKEIDPTLTDIEKEIKFIF